MERQDEDGPGPAGPGARQLVAAVIVLIVLIGAGLMLSGALRRSGGLQDCVMAGRTNCAPVR